MSYQFYTTEKNEDKLKEHILKQMEQAGATIKSSFTDPKSIIAASTSNSVAESLAESIIQVQKRGIIDPLKFATEVREELLNQHKSTLERAAFLSQQTKNPTTMKDLATSLTGVNASKQPVACVIKTEDNKTKTIPTLFDEIKIGAPAQKTQQVTQAPASPPPSDSKAQPAAPSKAPSPAQAAAKAPPPAATKAPMTTTTSSGTVPPVPDTPTSVTPPQSPPATQDNFESNYGLLSAVIGLSNETIFKGIQKGTDKTKTISESAGNLKQAIVGSLKPELQKRHVEFDDKDLSAVADITSTTIATHIHKLKTQNPDLKFNDPKLLQQQADTLGAEIRSALGQAGKDGKLGKLTDGMIVSYADILSGVNTDGAPTNRYGTNFHTLGATALAQAFGTPAVQEDHKKKVALKLAHSSFQGQGGTLDSSSIELSVDGALGQDYNAKTHDAVKALTKQKFSETDTYGDTKKAWDDLANQQKGGFMQSAMRFFMFLDALLEKFTGFSIMNSIMGPNSNPIATAAHEKGNERHLKATYEAIIESSPLALGWTADQNPSAQKWQQQLAERVTGITKDAEGNYNFVNKDGRFTGLGAVVRGLDVTGQMAGTDVTLKDVKVEDAETARKAAAEAQAQAVREQAAKDKAAREAAGANHSTPPPARRAHAPRQAGAGGPH